MGSQICDFLNQPNRPERRAERRMDCNSTPAELSLLSGGHKSITTVPATIMNVSKSGVKVVANTRVGTGQQVRIKMEKLVLFGEVRYCRAKYDMFESGVKISDVVGEHGYCGRLSEAQIELLAIGRGLTTIERTYARYHLRHCSSCTEQLRAAKSFFDKVLPCVP